MFNIIVYCGINFLLYNKFYYTLLVGFIVIYFMVAYMKLYLNDISNSKKANLIILVVSIILNTALILLTNYLGLQIPFLSNKMLYWNSIINPFIILISLTLFNLFKNYKFYSKLINYISSLSLLIYLLSENLLFKRTFFVKLYSFIYEQFTYNYISLWVLLIAIITFIVSIICTALYKETISKFIKEICNKVYKI